MPVTVKQLRRVNKLAGDNPTLEEEYACWGSTDFAEVEDALIALVPPTVGALVLQETEIESPEDESFWIGRARWGLAKARATPQTSAEEISFDISPQSIRVTQSLQTVLSTPAGAPDFKGGIGWDGQRFQGVDQFVEAFSFSITHYRPVADVDTTFIQSLRDAAFHTNDAPFRGNDTAECIFFGAAGSPRGSADYAIVFKFLAAKNATNIPVGDLIVASKNAWDNLWVLYEKVEDTGAKFITPRPKAAYVERLYQPISFTDKLGITA